VSPTSLVLAVAGIVLAAAFVRSALGFGDAVIAMPLLVALLGLRTATPLVAFMGPTIALLILARHWRKGDWKVSARLVGSSFAGIPIGIYLLTRLPEGPLKIALGLIILLYGLFGLLRPGLRIRNERVPLPYLVGFMAGILGGAYNTNGPLVVIYGRLKGWPPERFRATLQAYFLPAGIFILLGHGAAGLWTGEVIRLYLWALPALVLGVWAGGHVNRNLPGDRFGRYVDAALVVMGAFLIFRSVGL
jgi:uncharacterized membrane protein YfcA